MEADELKNNVVRDTNDEILERTACHDKQDDDSAIDCQVERENIMLGPDPDSMSSRG